MQGFARRARNTTVAAATACLAATVPAASAQQPFAAAPHPGTTWGGYVMRGGGFASISASWVQPAVRCTAPTGKYAPWVGLDGYGSDPVEQVGVETSCESGVPRHRPWFEMYPTPARYWDDVVAAGDRMTATVADRGGGRYVLTLTDLTRGWTEQVSRQGEAPGISAEAVVESPTGRYPDFGAVTFSHVLVNGAPLDPTRLQGVNSDGYGPGPLSGTSFTISR